MKQCGDVSFFLYISVICFFFKLNVKTCNLDINLSLDNDVCVISKRHVIKFFRKKIILKGLLLLLSDSTI